MLCRPPTVNTGGMANLPTAEAWARPYKDITA